MIDTHTGGTMQVRKGDTVRSDRIGECGFVHYVLPLPPMAMVEFPIWGRTFVYTDELVKVADLPLNEGWNAPSSISHNGRE